MTTYRDLVLKQKDKLDDKQDRLLFKRAVLTTEGGLQTSSDPLNDVWASLSEKRCWYMHEGAVQPAQILCRKVSDPYVGLGVIIGYADGFDQLEVLSDDFFLTGTGDPTGWASTSPRDFEPGGRKQMWVYTKVITPLATYPGSGIKVNVISGDYPYLGTRKSFAGSVNYDLSASVPGGGLCRYAGLYLDASNTLQTINGATTTAGSTPAEPSWPAGAFRLCVVLLTNGDTSIDFANIFDRRMAWSDQQSGSARVWPFAHVLTVSTTDTDADYSTVAAAIAAAAAGDAILLEMETSSETITVNKAVTLIGWSRAGTIFTNTITITSAATLINIKVSIAAGTNSKGFVISANTNLLNCEAVTAGSSTSRGVEISAGTTYIVQGYYEATGAGTSNEVFVSGGGAILEDPILSGGNVSGSVQGTYRNSLGYVTIAALTQLRFVSTASMTSGVWLIDESALLKTKEATLAAAITASASGDSIKLDTDTYSVSASQNIDTSITIEGDGPEATIYTTSVSNATAFDITTDSITVVFKDLTIKHTGGGVAATGIFSNNTGVTVVLDNCVLEISSGAGTTSRGLWIEAGTWILRNGSKIVVTSGTSKYGIYNDAGSATITIGAGCTVNGATDDIYGDQAGSTINIYGILTNRLASWAGTVSGSIDPRLVAFTQEVYQGTTIGLSDFVATINGAPSGASVTYNAPSSGNEATIVPAGTTYLAKMVLHNTTRGDSALISNVNTGTNVITLTANAPAGWANTDTITIRSQTNTSTFNTTSYFVDFELTSQVDPLLAGLEFEITYGDSGGAGQNVRLHPYKASVVSERRGFTTQSAQNASGYRPLPIISNRFCAAWTASGATTVNVLLLRAYKQLVYGL